MDKIDLSKIKTVPISERTGKAKVTDFSKVENLKKIPDTAVEYFIESIPDIANGSNFKELINRIITAKKSRKPVIFMFGAHVLKSGLAPIIIEMIKDGYITFLSTNGASLIHDFELSYCGNTSENVDAVIESGKFGVTEETLDLVNGIANRAADENEGLGITAGKIVSKYKYSKYSLFSQAFRLGIPITVHVAIGTDIIIQSDKYKGASWGKASHADFIKLCDEMKGLDGGGVVLNFGSAVILPEVFLKAINIVRNLGFKLEDFTAANFDMIRQYRPMTNIISRPVAGKGRGFNFVGYHELMLPLLYLCLKKK